MDKSFLIQITNNLYRLTLLFPKKEPLRYKMRELADDILSSFSSSFNLAEAEIPLSEKETKQIILKIDMLDCFFSVAKEQKWVSLQDILATQKEYANLRGELEKKSLETKKENPEKTGGMAERQEKILSFLKEQGKAQVWQLKQVLPEVTKRTLRRDFEDLLGQGLIQRMGEKNDTFYQIKTA